MIRYRLNNEKMDSDVKYWIMGRTDLLREIDFVGLDSWRKAGDFDFFRARGENRGKNEH